MALLGSRGRDVQVLEGVLGGKAFAIYDLPGLQERTHLCELSAPSLYSLEARSGSGGEWGLGLGRAGCFFPPTVGKSRFCYVGSFMIFCP